MNATAFETILLDVADIKAGYPFRGAIDALEPGAIAVIQMRNVDDVGGVNWSEVARVSLPTKRPADMLSDGDIIFTTRGRRNVALALDAVPYDAVCSPHFFVIRVFDDTRIMPAFLAWQINQRPAQDYLQQAATGSHILNITRGAIESLPVVVPPLDRQRALMKVVRTAERERSVLSQLIDSRTQQLDAIAARILTPTAKRPVHA